MQRYRWILAILATATLVGCTPSNKEDTEMVQESEKESVETTIIPSNQLDESYYKTLIPYKESASRGMIVSNIYTKYDIKEAETGLMRLSRNQFDTETHYFQEGHTHSRRIWWLDRKSNVETGLNPAAPEGTTLKYAQPISGIFSTYY